MPERLWKICMEFVVKNSAGKREKHFIDPQTGTAQKVGILLKVKVRLEIQEAAAAATTTTTTKTIRRTTTTTTTLRTTTAATGKNSNNKNYKLNLISSLVCF
jgi:hypothetical protein